MSSEILWRNYSNSAHHFLLHATSYSLCVVITDKTVYRLYQELFASLQQNGIALIVLTPGESTKTRETKEYIEDELFKLGARKNTLLIAVGGGVISDLTGFVASTYFRGIHWGCVPTTIMGMIDAAFGGKTGVNTSYGKNTLGTFYFPEFIGLDPSFLQTLSQLEKENGFAESIKYGCIAQEKLLESEKEYNLNPRQFLETCIKIKLHFTQADPCDLFLRKHLNFGHTVGHALEFGFNYRFSHGYCVAMGIAIEAHLNFHKGFLHHNDYTKIIRSINYHFRHLPWKEMPSASLLYTLCQRDKKNQDDHPTITLLQHLGKIQEQKNHFTPFSLSELEATYEEFFNGYLYQTF